MDDLNDHVAFDVEEINNHENYNSWNFDSDFSMLKLSREIDWAAHPTVRPVCLPSTSNNDYAGATATVTGWGRTLYGGSVSNNLQEVDVNVLSNSACRYVPLEVCRFLTS